MSRMRMQVMGWLAVGVVGVAVQLGVAARMERAVELGPPMVCHPIDIGDAKTIAEPDEKVSAGSVVQDTLAVLRTAPSVLVRMETLRRATLGVVKDQRSAMELLTRLAFAAMDAEAGNKKDDAALSYFDAAYLTGCYDQMGIEGVGKPGVADGVNGYLWAQHAMTLSGGGDRLAEMEFGAALLVHPAMHRGLEQVYRKHLDQAAKEAKKGSLLEKNVKAHEEKWRGVIGK